MSSLPLLFQDEDLVVIQKPSGLLVHRSAIDKYETQYALQIVRDQLGCFVYPVHRLDKPTSGALVFALKKQSARQMIELFSKNKVKKTYVALVRGWPQSQTINSPLSHIWDKCTDQKVSTRKPPQEAETEVVSLEQYELPVQVDRYPQSRYALVEAYPLSGRRHQVRRHLSHIRHPIIGDADHGVGKHNRFFDQQLGFRKLMLSCTGLEFPHPIHHEQQVSVQAPLDQAFNELLESLRRHQQRS